MKTYSITADSHAAPGFLAMSGRSELGRRFAASARVALADYFTEEGMAVPGPITEQDGGKAAYTSNMLMVFEARPVCAPR